MKSTLGTQPLDPEPRAPTDDGLTDITFASVYPAGAVCRGILLDSCAPFDRILVKTRRSDYELIIVDAASGEVLVRGGHYFEGFRRAWLTGSVLGGSAVKVGR